MVSLQRCSSHAATVLLLAFAPWQLSAAAQTIQGRVPEGYLRQSATTTIPPEYPRDAIATSAEGVSVAEIRVNPSGSVTSVEVLEAPHPSIAESMRRALKQWKFRPFKTDGGEPRAAIGKVTYYFVLTGTESGVYEPSRAPYIGRWPQKDSVFLQ